MTPISTKSFVSWSFTPDPTAWGSLQRSLDPLAVVFRGLLLKLGQMRKDKEGEGREFALCPRKKKVGEG